MYRFVYPSFLLLALATACGRSDPDPLPETIPGDPPEISQHDERDAVQVDVETAHRLDTDGDGRLEPMIDGYTLGHTWVGDEVRLDGRLVGQVVCVGYAESGHEEHVVYAPAEAPGDAAGALLEVRLADVNRAQAPRLLASNDPGMALIARPKEVVNLLDPNAPAHGAHLEERCRALEPASRRAAPRDALANTRGVPNSEVPDFWKAGSDG